MHANMPKKPVRVCWLLRGFSSALFLTHNRLNIWKLLRFSSTKKITLVNEWDKFSDSLIIWAYVTFILVYNTTRLSVLKKLSTGAYFSPELLIMIGLIFSTKHESWVRTGAFYKTLKNYASLETQVSVDWTLSSKTLFCVGKVSEVIIAWLVNKSISLGFHSSWRSDVKLVTLATGDKGVLRHCGFYD